MLVSMRHIEIHTIETENDSVSAFTSGLIPEPYFIATCTGCGDHIGVLDDRFEPYVVVLEDEDEWYLCFYCAESVTNPDDTGSLSSYVDSDDDDDDLEAFLF